jgi:hypothetical protein
MKNYADKRRRATHHNFRVWDKVLLNQLSNKRIHKKYLKQYSSIEHTIKNIKGSMITVNEKNGKEFTLNSSFFQPISINLKLNSNSEDEYFDNVVVNTPNNNNNNEQQQQNIFTPEINNMN